MNTIKIKSWQKDNYTIIEEGGHWSCDCKGYKFGGGQDCKHIKKVKQEILFFEEKEQLKSELEIIIKKFVAKYNIVPKIGVNKKTGAVKIYLVL